LLAQEEAAAEWLAEAVPVTVALPVVLAEPPVGVAAPVGEVLAVLVGVTDAEAEVVLLPVAVPEAEAVAVPVLQPVALAVAVAETVAVPPVGFAEAVGGALPVALWTVSVAVADSEAVGALVLLAEAVAVARAEGALVAVSVAVAAGVALLEAESALLAVALAEPVGEGEPVGAPLARLESDCDAVGEALALGGRVGDSDAVSVVLTHSEVVAVTVMYADAVPQSDAVAEEDGQAEALPPPALPDATCEALARREGLVAAGEVVAVDEVLGLATHGE
jgi:hypothetical protein